ncbi:hypothetical protein Esti_002765 [Eimeria stiedai]
MPIESFREGAKRRVALLGPHGGSSRSQNIKQPSTRKAVGLSQLHRTLSELAVFSKLGSSRWQQPLQSVSCEAQLFLSRQQHGGQGGPCERGPACQPLMRHSVNQGAFRSELPDEALQACAPQQQAALPHLSQKQQEHLLSARSPDGCVALPLRAAAAAASSSSSAPAAGLCFPQHQRSFKPLPSLSFAASPQGITGHPPLMGSQRQTPLAWDVTPTPSTPREELPPTQPVSNAASRESSAAARCCSSSSLKAAAVLPVAPAEEQPILYAQGAHSATAEKTLVRPSDDWVAQPAHPLPVFVEPWQQQHREGMAAAAVTRTEAGLPLSSPSSARSRPMDSCAGGSPFGRPYDARPAAAGSPSIESPTQAHGKQQVLLQKLQQNEQMQRHILRNLQQQQQRWRHLLEACDASSLVGAPNNSTVNPCIPGPSAAPTFSSPEARGLLQPEEEQHEQVNPLTLQQSLQQRVVSGDAIPLRAPVRRTQRQLGGGTSPTARQGRLQAAGQLREAPPLQPAEAGQPQAACQPFDHMQQSASQVMTAANVVEGQSWAWQQQQQHQHQQQPPATIASQAQQQPLSSWLPHTTQKPFARSEPLHVVSDKLEPQAATRVAAVELDAAASIGETVAAEASDLMRHFEPPEEKQGLLGSIRGKAGSRRRRGRRVLGKNAGVQGQSKCSENQAAVLKADNKGACSPQSCSRSPSVARTAACAVLGFGSGMPPQTKLAENPKVGLVNLGGGSCFLNVVLQCLARLQPLRDFYLHYAKMLPPSDVLGRQYEAYTSYLEASRQNVRRLKRGPHQLIPTPTYTTSVTWELAVVINHMWRSPESVRFLKPEALYQVCCRIMPDFDPREMQDSDEFLRLLLDFLDGELRAAATGVPLRKALMMQAMPKKLEQWRPSRRYLGVELQSARATQEAHHTQTEEDGPISNESSFHMPSQGAPSSSSRSTADLEHLDFADLPTLFSVFFEGAEVDKVRCTRCGRCTATAVPFKSLAIAMTQEAQEESCQHASLRLKPSSFFHLLTKVNLVECLNRHFADDCDSLKLSSGEGYFCEQCNSKQDAVKSCSLVKDHLPFILCLTLKRFVRGKETYKIWNPVHFDEFVDLSRYVECSSDSDVLPEAPKAQDFKRGGIDALEPGPQLLSSGAGPPSPAEEATAATGTSSVEKGLDGEASETGRGKGGGRGESTAVHAEAATHAIPEKSFCCTELASSISVNSAAASASQRLEKFIYELVALVEHEGPATEQGHYVCYVKDMVSEAWFRADDKVVEPVDLQRVLSACPYILFYQRSSEASECGTLTGSSEPQQPTGMHAGFAGLREQLKVAEGLSHGHWQQWQNLIAKLVNPRPKSSPNTTRLFTACNEFAALSVKAGASEDDSSSDVGKRFVRQRRRIARLGSSPWHAALDAPPEVSACNSHSAACSRVPSEGAMPADAQFNAAACATETGRQDKSQLHFPGRAGTVGGHCVDAYGDIPIVQAAPPACSVVEQRRLEHLTRS